MSVEQVQRTMAAEPLIVVESVDRHVQRTFESGPHRKVRRRAAVRHADIFIGLAVDPQRGRHLDVRVPECAQFILPILAFELEEQSAQDGHFIEWLVAVESHIGWRQASAGLGWSWGVSPRAAPGRLCRHETACWCALFGVEHPVLVRVEPIEDLQLHQAGSRIGGTPPVRVRPSAGRRRYTYGREVSLPDWRRMPRPIESMLSLDLSPQLLFCLRRCIWALRTPSN